MFVIPIISWWCIQLVKLVIDFFTKKKICRNSIRSSWWFPSVHSGIVASIATLMFLEYGIDSSQFAIAFTFAFLFWYDAANVRYEAGQHASFLNQITEELKELSELIPSPDETPIMTHRLKERLWHTTTEVVWWIVVGIIITRAIYTYFPQFS